MQQQTFQIAAINFQVKIVRESENCYSYRTADEELEWRVHAVTFIYIPIMHITARMILIDRVMINVLQEVKVSTYTSISVVYIWMQVKVYRSCYLTVP